MIIDNVENGLRYASLSPAFEKAFRFLRETDLSSLPDGRFEIDGEEVFGNLAVNDLDRVDPAYEAHDLYADIQVIVKGEERFWLGWNPVLHPPVEGMDFRTCEAHHGVEFILQSGQFVVFLPGEAHAPGLVAYAPGPCRKLVIKVRCH